MDEEYIKVGKELLKFCVDYEKNGEELSKKINSEDDEKNKLNYIKKNKINTENIPDMISYYNATDEEKMKIVNNNKNYKFFGDTFPIVFKFILFQKKFYVEIFKKYFKYVQNNKPTPEEKAKMYKNGKEKARFKNNQYAKYMKWVLQYEKPRLDKSLYENYFNKVLDELNKESDEFFDAYERGLKKFKNDEKKRNEDLKDDLKKFLLSELK